MPSRKLAVSFSSGDGGEVEEMSRRIAGCRARLRKGRAARTMNLRAPESGEGQATGEAEASGSPAEAARGEETEREH